MRRSRRAALLLTTAVALPVLAVTGCSGPADGQSPSGSSSAGGGSAAPQDPASAATSDSSGSSADEEKQMLKKLDEAEKAADAADSDASNDPR